MLVFLDVVPDELICQPCGLSGRQFRVLQGLLVSNGKLLTALRAHNSLHDDGARCAFLVLSQSLGDAIRPGLLCYQILTTAVRAAAERDRCSRPCHRRHRRVIHHRHRRHVPSWGVLRSR